jgi:CopG family nickel-responsive transcriptional regulator
MADLERIGVSVDKGLLEKFDRLLAELGYENRSEAIRDLIREKLNSRQLTDKDTEVVAAVCLVYDHHASGLVEKLTELQHSHLLQTICTTHIHLSKENCMEIIVLRGRAEKITSTAEHLISQKGVKLGRINMIADEAL